MDTAKMWNITQAAREVGVSRPTVLKWIKLGLLPVYRPRVNLAFVDPERVRELKRTAQDRLKEATRPAQGRDGLWSVAEAARELGVSNETIYYWIKVGKLERKSLPDSLVTFVDAQEARKVRQASTHHGIGKRRTA